MSLLQRVLSPISNQITNEVRETILKELNKKDNSKTFGWDEPYLFNNLYNSNKRRKDEEGTVSYRQLRNISIHYPIARACIDYLKRKIAKLDWAIVGKDIAPTDQRVLSLTDFFRTPEGYKSSYREFIDSLIEDFVVIGAFAIEKVKTRNNEFLAELKTVDAATIQILSDGSGRKPKPPQAAYKQVIQGREQARLTIDELIYVRKNARSNSLYGISPLQSVLIQAEAAIYGSEYTKAWFTDNNVPMGFGEVPADWSTKDIKKFQDYFDALLAGNYKKLSRIKMVPSGFKYTPAKKPEQISYERFELWMMQLTCSVFGVPPQDIGFTHQVNKSSSETQQEIGQEHGMRPIAQVIQQTFTELIQQDFGFRDLEFTFLDVDPVDKKLEADIQQMRLDAGIVSVDEIRANEGLEPIGLGHYVQGNVTLLENLKNDGITGQSETDSDTEGEDDTDKLNDFRLWKKHSIAAIKNNKPFKKFRSEHIDEGIIEDIYFQLDKCKTVNQVYHLFQPYIDGRIEALGKLNRLLDGLHN